MDTVGWTRADQAELDAILWFFMDAYYAHRKGCRDCHPREWCASLSTAWDAVEAWARTRRLLSRAEHLRACQNLLEDARAV